MFKMQTGTSMVHIPYRGSGAAIADVLSGQVQVFMTTPPSVMGHIQAGKLKGLAVTSKARHPGVPQVPTTDGSGAEGLRARSLGGDLRAGRHAARRGRQAHASIQQALDLPETKTRAATAGIDLRYLPPAASQALVERETAFWAKTIKAAKITAD